MTVYVEVAVNLPQINEVFDYRLPDEMAQQVKPGCLVVVPFGAQTVQGIVTHLLDAPRVAVTRPVMLLVDPQPALTEDQLKLAAWMAHESLSSLAACLDLMLPPGLSQHADSLYQLNAARSSDESPVTKQQQRILDLLAEKGSLRGRQLEAAFKRANWKSSMQSLVRSGRVVSRPVLLPPSVRPKVVRTVQLSTSPEQVRARRDEVGRTGTPAQKRRQAMLDFLLKEPWPVDASWVYAASGGNLADLEKLAGMGLVSLGESEVWRDPLQDVETTETEIPALTPDQQAVWQQVQLGLHSNSIPKPHFLYGVTGSGKTEIYLRAVEETLRIGKQAIVLVPEIALTPQTVRRFVARFPGQVGLIHSQLSEGERYDTWRRARAGQLPVIVGPRSALFAPLPNLGLIVMDECHESSYSQTDYEPRYHSVPVAIEYARLTKSLLLLGSATPEVGLMYHAVRDQWPMLKLPVRILAHRRTVERQVQAIGQPAATLLEEGETASLPLPPVEVIDMRRELAAGNRSIFSVELQRSLQHVLENHQQAILFLNRRGSATYVFCRSCGETLTCPRCDLPLTYHTGGRSLICHTCNYRRKLPNTCPQCGSDQIRQYGAGTEKVEALVNELFPQARVLRWDAETTRQKGAHDLLLSHFIHGRADILIGTQMLAKGLDLPLVTLVGVVLADVGLNLPDFRAGERTFQLLTQVAGRAGRSPLGGKVILQTFIPEHYAIQAAAKHDYRTFYQQELAHRRKMGYPPYSRLVRLEFRHAHSEDAQAAAMAMSNQLETWLEASGQPSTELIGPVPCFFARQNGLYRWQIILRGSQPAEILRGKPLPGWRVEIDPVDLL